MATDISTNVRTDESKDDNPEAPEGWGHPVRPDDENENEDAEGHGRNSPAIPDDENQDTEGHNAKWG